MFVFNKILDEVDLCKFPAYRQLPWQWSCSAYAVAACLNILWMKLDPQDLWDEVVKWPASAWSRWLTWVRNYIKSRYWVLSEKIIWLNSMLGALSKWRPIILETHNISFPLTGKAQWAMANFNWDWKYKHVRCITWYSKKTKLFKCRNSHGDMWWDRWYFYIKFQDIWNLWVMYSLYK